MMRNSHLCVLSCAVLCLALTVGCSGSNSGPAKPAAQMDEIQEIIRSTGALDYTATKAREAANSAIAIVDCLPDTKYRDALMSLAEFAIQRRS